MNNISSNSSFVHWNYIKSILMEKPYFFGWNLQDKISYGRLHCCYYKGHNCVKYGKFVICLYVSQKKYFNNDPSNYLILWWIKSVLMSIYNACFHILSLPLSASLGRHCLVPHVGHHFCNIRCDCNFMSIHLWKQVSIFLGTLLSISTLCTRQCPVTEAWNSKIRLYAIRYMTGLVN